MTSVDFGETTTIAYQYGGQVINVSPGPSFLTWEDTLGISSSADSSCEITECILVDFDTVSGTCLDSFSSSQYLSI